MGGDDEETCFDPIRGDISFRLREHRLGAILWRWLLWCSRSRLSLLRRRILRWARLWIWWRGDRTEQLWATRKMVPSWTIRYLPAGLLGSGRCVQTVSRILTSILMRHRRCCQCSLATLLALSGHPELRRTCPLSGVKRTLQLNAMTFALDSKELVGLTLR